jgi:hypothetical protein
MSAGSGSDIDDHLSPGPRGHRRRTTRPSPLPRRPTTAFIRYDDCRYVGWTRDGARSQVRAHVSRGHGGLDGGDMGTEHDSASFRSPWRKSAECRTAPPAHRSCPSLQRHRGGHCRGDEGAVWPHRPRFVRCSGRGQHTAVRAPSAWQGRVVCENLSTSRTRRSGGPGSSAVRHVADPRPVGDVRPRSTHPESTQRRQAEPAGRGADAGGERSLQTIPWCHRAEPRPRRRPPARVSRVA